MPASQALERTAIRSGRDGLQVWQAVRQVQTLPRGAQGLRDAAGSTPPDTG